MGRLPSAAGMVAALALFLVLRVSYFLPIETRMPSSAALMIANLYHNGAIVEQSDHEAYRWYLLATGKTASSP